MGSKKALNRVGAYDNHTSGRAMVSFVVEIETTASLQYIGQLNKFQCVIKYWQIAQMLENDTF